MRNGKVTVSKEDFLNWLTCPGYAWVTLHQPDLSPPEDANTRRKQIAGDMVESLARSRFPSATLIEADTVEEALQLTQTALGSGATTILHGTFLTDRGLFIEADVLVREESGWHLIEIRSTAGDPDRPNGLIKKHLPDMSYQTMTLEEAGLAIHRSSLMHVHKYYRRNGKVQPGQALALTDVTPFVHKARAQTAKDIDAALSCLQQREIPAKCHCDRNTRAHRCSLFDYLHPDIPNADTIYHIAGIHRNTLLPAIDRGIINLVDWPDDLPLSAKQQHQVQLARSGEEIIQSEGIKQFLDTLKYPLHFLDYETFQQPIPLWEGFVPQQQVPFQYSVHIVEEDGRIMHREHMCVTRGENPIPSLVAHLHDDMRDHGSVIVWNKAFEESRNREMAALVPEHAAFLTGINERMVDLADIVSRGWWVHPEFGGRWSLKSVLPVAAPDLRYDDLEISDGSTASELWTRCMVDDIDTVTDDERAGVIAALRAYCSLDTMAMIRIWEHVQHLITK